MRRALFISAALLPILLHGQDSRNGYWFPPRDTLRIFIIYAEVQNDPDDPNGMMGWMPGQLPPDPGYLFDHQLRPGQVPRGMLTKYYYQASFGKYIVLADHYPEIVSIGYDQVRNRGIDQVMDRVFDSSPGDVLSASGYSINAGDFDYIKTSGTGMPKQTRPDSLIDLVMVMWRVNSNFTRDLSAGFVFPGNRRKPMKGMKGMNAYSSFVNKNYTRYTILRHEFSHVLLGGNNFHTGGAGAGTKTFMSDVGGYAMLSSHLMSSPVYCAFDRRRLGWKYPGNEYQISARNPSDGSEIRADLSYGQDFTHGSDDFILRDFVETGDAIRIAIPYLQTVSDAVPAQWLWLENHQKLEGNIDHEGSTRRGLYAYMQVGKETMRGLDAFGGLCNYTWPVSAFGNWDFILREDENETEITPERSNPLSGYNNLVYGAYDLKDHDGLIYRNEVFLSSRLKMNGSYPDESHFNYKTYQLFGTSFDAFQPGDKIAPDRNPTASSLLTYRTSSAVSARPGNPAGSDNRVIHLNGISVEFLEQLDDGSIRLRIRFDDTNVSRDVRWCGEIQLHEGIRLLRGTEIRLEQGLTPTRPKDPVLFKGDMIFADPTKFTLLKGSSISAERKAGIMVREGSSLVLGSGSSISLERGARIVVSDSSSLILEPGAIIDGKGRILLQDEASADFPENTVEVRVKRR